MSPLLTVDGLWKKYSRDLRKSTRNGARDLLGLRGRGGPDRPLEESEFWALRDVSFSVRRGEVLGILGHNGAGKSTLLKIVAGTLRADRGTVDLTGSLGYIIEMSAGFSPTMTGRENVAVRGRLLGKRGKDLEAYVREVEYFAELEEFYDAPVQFYSSGMKARLGFGASVAINPDVLILDEVLAVGDLAFRLKCYEKINELARSAAVLFVSHSLGHMRRLCSRGIYLEKGRVRYLGDIQEAISNYQDQAEAASRKKPATTIAPDRAPFKLIMDGEPLDGEGHVPYGRSLSARIDIGALPQDSSFRFVLRSAGNDLLMDWNSGRTIPNWPSQSSSTIQADLGPMELNPGTYNIFLQVMGPGGTDILCITEPQWFRVTGQYLFDLPVQKTASWTFEDPTRT